MESVTIKVGGKLYWGGEYAVVEAGHTAVIKSVDCFLSATLQFSESNSGNIQSSLYHRPLCWHYRSGKLHIERTDEYSLIAETLGIMSSYLTEQGRELKVFDLNIDSDLHDSEFQKYGFGSSGAVVVAVVRGILELYGMPADHLTVFKLACLVLLRIGSNGSMGDVACCTYGGLIAYTSFERKEIAQRLLVEKISEIVASDWNYLQIRHLEQRLSMLPLIGWTGQEAISSQYVYQVGLSHDKEEYRNFLKESEEGVQAMIEAMQSADKKGFKGAVHRLKQGLRYLSTISQTEIETERLQTLSEIAERYDAVGKLSGAGGGDCGIIFLFSDSERDAVISEMEEKGIRYLNY